MNKHFMVNVVCYDGIDSWVSKIIFKGDNEKQWRIDFELMGFDCEPLKFDRLYDLSFDNIMAIINSEEHDHKLIADRFKAMYF